MNISPPKLYSESDRGRDMSNFTTQNLYKGDGMPKIWSTWFMDDSKRNLCQKLTLQNFQIHNDISRIIRCVRPKND